MKLNKKELKKIRAGAAFSSSLVNSLIRGVNSFLDIGRYLGSSVRRMVEKNICPLK